MASNTPVSIKDMPTEMVANILEQLDTVQQLKVALSSHRIFHDAFSNNVRSIIQSVIKNEISEDVLPFSFALLEASRSDFEDTQAVPRVMKNLNDRINYPSLNLDHLATLTISDLRSMSRTHSVVESLCEKFCRDSLPLFTKWLYPATTNEVGRRDRFRICRALYRFQIMCDLLCQPSTHRSRNEDVIEKERQEVLLAFSPWVNEQLVCIYFFLQRTVLEAYDDVAAHDIVWGEIPVVWTDEPWWEDPQEYRVQEFLLQGLEFLNSVAEATNFDERIELLDNAIEERRAASKHSSSLDRDGLTPFEHIYCVSNYSNPLLEQDIDVETTLARAYEMEAFESLVSSLDKPDNTTSSVSAQTWLNSQWDKSLEETVNDFYTDANLWMCGYVMWEAAGQVPVDIFKHKVSALREEPHLFQRLRAFCGEETAIRSEHMRTDLWLAGAKGYWPLEEIDFSRVYGLDDERKGRVLEKWKNGKVGVSDNEVDESLIAMTRAMDCREDNVEMAVGTADTESGTL